MITQGNIARYKIEKELGRGAFGVVYYATNKITHEECAIKELKPKEIRDIFISREVAAMYTISNTKVNRTFFVSLKDYFLEESSFYMVMEYCKGRLSDLISKYKEKGLPKYLLVKLAIDIASGLRELHSLNLVHRDFKPDNILLSDMEEEKMIAKIADFGLAKPYGLESIKLLSPKYIPLGLSVFTSSADIWSFGVILYEMLFGIYPAEISDTEEEMKMLNSALRNKGHITIKQRKDLDSSTKGVILDIILNCISPQAELRPKAEEIIEVLKKIQ